MLSLSEASSSLFVFFIVVCVKKKCQNAIFVFGHRPVKLNYYLNQEAFIEKLAEHKWLLMKCISTKITDLSEGVTTPSILGTLSQIQKNCNREKEAVRAVSRVDNRTSGRQEGQLTGPVVSRRTCRQDQQTGPVDMTGRQDQQTAGGPVDSRRTS